jgi:hypothetical protein
MIERKPHPGHCRNCDAPLGSPHPGCKFELNAGDLVDEGDAWPPQTQMDRIEEKVDMIFELLLSFGEEDEEKEDGPTIDLDGQVAGGARDQSQSLG